MTHGRGFTKTVILILIAGINQCHYLGKAALMCSSLARTTSQKWQTTEPAGDNIMPFEKLATSCIFTKSDFLMDLFRKCFVFET